MPSIQDTIYPRIKHNLSTEDLRSVYTPTRSEIEMDDFYLDLLLS
ncbi:hypothetical protein [Bacillus paramycoides]|nr:hypothetical protein [Bacillus paramycoides]MED1116433.1 hypothetical protein [Bacillus paramycoides]